MIRHSPERLNVELSERHYSAHGGVGEGTADMPRPSPLTLISIPQIERRQRLPQKHDYAGLLGFLKLPDDVAGELAHFIALARATHRKNGQVQPPVAGLTWPRMAAELGSHAKKLRRGPNMHVRQKLQNQCFGLDTEAFLRLKPLTAAPDAELLTAIEARQQEVAVKPQANPQTQARESAGGVALWFFLIYAAPSIRDEPGCWWRFVLAFLDDARFPTEKLYQHPESLRPLLEHLKSLSEWLLACLKPELDELLKGLSAEWPR